MAKLLSTLFDRHLSDASTEELEQIAELRNRFSSFGDVEIKDMSASQAAWADNMNRLRELVLNDNPREFLRWDVIQKTMFVSHATYVKKELSFLKRLPDWKTRWSDVINEVCIGHPPPYPFYPKSSGNLIHQAYHLAKFEEYTRTRVEKFGCIFEFGGGYGAMCRLLFNLGFQGVYLIYDLPHFSSLQEFYLKSAGIPVQSYLQFHGTCPAVICLSASEPLGGNFLEEFLRVYGHNGMFIATWSLSEAPMHIRKVIVPLISDFRGYLFAYQHRFEEINNLDFFSKLRNTLSEDISWYTLDIEHLPGNSYLFGIERNT